MTSAINYSDLDEDFPLAGVDNESQGFRDNFAIIKAGLAVAQAELSELQSKSIFKEALTGTTIDNDMSGETIVSVNLSSSSRQTYGSAEPVTNNQDITYDFGEYHHYVLGANVIFRLTDWPNSENVSKFTIELKSDGLGTYQVDFTSNITPSGTGTIKFSENFPTTLVVNDSNNPTIIEFWSRNRGLTVYANYLGKFE